ncbi:CFEM-domain-containing protein [Polyplosphaeria fusca]|uniref:CFEM-domain-containing protein n=1 Tax=Polyplosphaeria fusca TaxID=682080 RepID=A0A9P4V808_9PLEO|nr:CFEM-domain-containing protein [Polyplosphaeria fusca]
MKTFTAASLVAALASIASAQFDNIPTCALTCFVDPLTNDGCSGLTDFACHCKKFDTLISAVTPCVQGACSADDQAKVISGVEDTCKQAGVTVSVPNPSATGAPASSSAAASSAAESSAAESSAAEASSSAAMSVQTSVSAIPTPTGNSTVPSPSASSVSQFTGAAALPTQAAGLMGAAALALLAL